MAMREMAGYKEGQVKIRTSLSCSRLHTARSWADYTPHTHGRSFVRCRFRNSHRIAVTGGAIPATLQNSASSSPSPIHPLAETENQHPQCQVVSGTTAQSEASSARERARAVSGRLMRTSRSQNHGSCTAAALCNAHLTASARRARDGYPARGKTQILGRVSISLPGSCTMATTRHSICAPFGSSS